LIDQWDYITDQLGRPPTLKEYSERWNVPLSTTYDVLEEFRRLFPSERDPERVVREIWDGVEAQQDPYGTPVDMHRVKVVPQSETPDV
jgi:hypothetical protein